MRRSVCPECNARNPTESRHCSQCGTSLEGATIVRKVEPGQEELLKLQRQQTRATKSTSRNVSCIVFIILTIILGPIACVAIVLATGVLATLAQ